MKKLPIAVMALLLLAAAPVSQPTYSPSLRVLNRGMKFPRDAFASRGATWFAGDEALRFADNCLTFQTPAGGWPKNTDLLSKPRDLAAEPPDFAQSGTFDNEATILQIRFIGVMYKATHQQRFLDAYRRGLDFIFSSQYPNGGWPQYAPNAPSYHANITFNDLAMVHVMTFLRDLADNGDPEMVDAATRQHADEAFNRGIDCILKCQIRVDGQLTGWCAQHDPNTLAPAKARIFELPSISGGEGAAILSLLMDIKQPSPAVRRSINAAAAWFERSKITGLRPEVVSVDPATGKPDKQVMVADPNAPPLWARFYDIATNKPMFCGRDGVLKWDISEIKSGKYHWYTPMPASVLEKYKKWRETCGE